MTLHSCVLRVKALYKVFRQIVNSTMEHIFPSSVHIPFCIWVNNNVSKHDNANYQVPFLGVVRILVLNSLEISSTVNKFRYFRAEWRTRTAYRNVGYLVAR